MIPSPTREANEARTSASLGRNNCSGKGGLNGRVYAAISLAFLSLFCRHIKRTFFFSADVNPALPTCSLLLHRGKGKRKAVQREENTSIQHDKVLYCFVFLTLRGESYRGLHQLYQPLSEKQFQILSPSVFLW